MKRILAMLLSVICVLSFTCVSTYADEKSEDEEKAASIAESYLSAAAKNMWLYPDRFVGCVLCDGLLVCPICSIRCVYGGQLLVLLF